MDKWDLWIQLPCSCRKQILHSRKDIVSSPKMSSPGLMFVALLSPSQELPLTNTKLVTTKTTPNFGAISTTFNNSNDLSCEKKCFKRKKHIVKIVWISVSPLVLFADRWLWECHRPFGLPASQGLGIEPAQMNFPRSRVPRYVFSWHLLTVFDFLYHRCLRGYCLGEMIHSRIATEKWPRLQDWHSRKLCNRLQGRLHPHKNQNSSWSCHYCHSLPAFR